MAEIELMDINEIQPYEKNPRKNDDAVEAVAESIKRFGFKNPILVDREHVIIAGHTRYRAAMLLGMDEVPVSVLDLSEEKAKAFRLADNKVSDFAEWDEEKLRKELAEISEDMSIFGFDEEQEELAEDLSKPTHRCPKCGFEW